MLKVKRVTTIALLVLSTLGCQQLVEPAERALRLNDIQMIGTHNSYKQFMPANELALIKQFNPQQARYLEYGFGPLDEQLDAGMRQLEIDVYHDPEGGRYSRPLMKGMVGDETTEMPEVMKEPGFKVLHVQDIDYRSSCLTFVDCLQQLKAWSHSHPRHVPILVLINAKEKQIPLPGTTKPLPFTPAVFDLLDREILSVFSSNQLIVPDQVRGDFATLREAVTQRGWPSLEASRGKVFFALDAGKEQRQRYLSGHASLRDRVMIASLPEDHDGAAYMTKNSAVRDREQIAELVRKGFVVRTTADSQTREARDNDYRRLEAALASGAQYISTDYYRANPDFSSYKVQLPDGAVARCNPRRVDPACKRINEE